MRDPRRVAAASAVLLTALLAAVLPTAPQAAPSTAQAVLQEINRVRAEHGLVKLRGDARLARASRWHVRDLMSRDVFEHGDFDARMRRFDARGPRFGENLAWAGGSRAAARSVVQMWLDSPPHRANLLRRGWRRAGIGVARGTFGGYPDVQLVAVAFAGR